jgi:LPS sulfotransferase NodH
MVLFQGRTGSTFFVEALDSHPDVSARYEELTAYEWLEEDGDAQLEEVRRLLRAPARPGTRAIGFKTKLRDVLDREGLAGVLGEVGARLIHLKRRNLVKLTVSSFNSERVHEQTGDWNVYCHEAAPAAPLTIEPEAFRARLREREHYESELDRFVATAARPTLTLFYEDLLIDPQGTLELAFRFLGLEPIPASGRTLKVTSDDLRSALVNFDELRASVAEARHRRMFDEVLVRAAAG